MIKRIRILLSTICFVGIVLMFVDYKGPLYQYLSWLAKIQFWPALTSATLVGAVSAVAVIILTLLFGRIYCSTICPMGVFQDIIAFISLKIRHGKYTYKPVRQFSIFHFPLSLRSAFLALMIILFPLGLSSLLAPYSAFGRILSTMVHPLYIWCNNILADIAESMDSYMFYHLDMIHMSILTLAIAIATLVIVGALAAKGGRTYCNTVCPVGTILSLFARFSLLKVHIDTDKCKNCGKCVRNCKASCIDLKNHTVDYSRCVVCGDCLDNCKFTAMSYGRPSAPSNYSNPSNPSDPRNPSNPSALSSRRSFLLGMAMATTAAALAQEKKKVDGGLAAIEDKQEPKRHTPILPPGAISMQHMSHHCTACQLCVSVCPNRVLRPSTDLHHFMQPVSSYDMGYCRPECNACGAVCPAGAIHFVPKEEKISIKKGTAIFLHKNCLALAQEADCGLCAENCPTQAITMVHTDPDDDNSPTMPSVDESRCIGCGACENMCPARPFSAIYVEGIEVQKEI